MGIKRIISFSDDGTQEREKESLSPECREDLGGSLPGTEGTEKGERRDEKRTVPPDPESPPRPRRRTFPAREKLRILDTADACVRHGEIGALLRREGIYSSTLARWRKQRDEGLLTANNPLVRGRKKSTAREMERHVDKLERHNRRLEEELRKARLIIEAQKKIAEILGVDSQSLDNEGND